MGLTGLPGGDCSSDVLTTNPTGARRHRMGYGFVVASARHQRWPNARGERERIGYARVEDSFILTFWVFRSKFLALRNQTGLLAKQDILLSVDVTDWCLSQVYGSKNETSPFLSSCVLFFHIFFYRIATYATKVGFRFSAIHDSHIYQWVTWFHIISFPGVTCTTEQ